MKEKSLPYSKELKANSPRRMYTEPLDSDLISQVESKTLRPCEGEAIRGC
jgi:hypothetical protein